MMSLPQALCSIWQSSIGKKLIVAITGAMLVGFLLGHMSGNLLVFAGRDALNSYAQFLHGMLHGTGIWVARIGLLGAIGLHIWGTVKLSLENRAARKNEYEMDATVQASRSSRIMVISGLTILAFVVFHLLHYTVQVQESLRTLVDQQHLAATGLERHDVYGMVIRGFQNVFVSLFYIVAISLLCSHLHHGIGSIFQTLGWRNKKNHNAIELLGKGVSFLIWAGFVIVPLSVLLGVISFQPFDPNDVAAPAIQAGL